MNRHVPDEAGGTIIHPAVLDVLDDGPEKPVHIWSRIGRRPILAAGSANGEFDAALRRAPVTPILSLLVLHDDDRECV